MRTEIAKAGTAGAAWHAHDTGPRRRRRPAAQLDRGQEWQRGV